ncbi:hypothetical protein WH47_05938, partial [Habropoda laboriosa]
LDFFLWEILKNIAYQEKPTKSEGVKQRIIATCTTIKPEMITSVRTSAIRRFQGCVDANGHHFEHLL